MNFPVRVVRRPIMFAAFPILAALVVAPYWGPLVSKVEAAVSTLSAPSITTGIGYAVDVPITLDSAPNGISGFEMIISLDNPAVATIDGIVIPPELGLTYVDQISTSQIAIIAVDLSQVLQGNLTGLTLATLNLTTTKQGSTAIHISLTRLDDDDGLPLDIQVVDGSLTVKKKFNNTGGGGGGGKGNNGGGKGGGPKK